MTQVIGRMSKLQDCPYNLANLSVEKVVVHLFKRITMYHI